MVLPYMRRPGTVSLFLLAAVLILVAGTLLVWYFTPSPPSPSPGIPGGNQSIRGTLPGHPRLYFSAADLPVLRAKTTTAPTSATWAGIRNEAMQTSFPTNPADRITAHDRLRYASFYYAVTGDTAVGNRAKGWLLQVCTWPTWMEISKGGHIYYNGGLIPIAVGEAYDWLYPLMTDTERQTVRTAIIEKALKPLQAEYQDGMYRYEAKNNRGGFLFGGIGVAGLAILGEEPGNPDLDPCMGTISGLMRDYVNSFDRNGGWSEGIAYQFEGLADASGALYYIEADRRVTGEDLYANPKFRNASYFPLYLLPPDRKGATDGFNDASGNVGYGAGVMARFASAYGNGYAQWYYNNGPLYKYDKLPDFIFYNASVTETAPDDLPESRIFPDIGWVAMRTGWNTGDSLIAFRAGPILSGHNRPEQNSFMYDALGERLIVLPGESSTEFSDPHYQDYYAAAVGQNTILVNGDPNSQPLKQVDDGMIPAGTIVDFVTTDFYDSVTGEAAGAYAGKLARFTRQIMFLKPDYAVVFDDLASSGGPVEFDSLLHALGTNSIQVSGDTVTVTRNAVTLYAKILMPGGFRYSIQGGRPVYLEGEDRPTSYIRLYPPTASPSAQFLIVLYPLDSSETLPPITRINGSGVIGARVERSGVTDTILFSPAKTINTNDIVSDGESCMVSEAEGIERFAIRNGGQLRFRGRYLFSSPGNASAAFRYAGKFVSGTVIAAAPLRVGISSARPESVMINGARSDYQYDPLEGLLFLPVGPGENGIEVTTVGNAG